MKAKTLILARIVWLLVITIYLFRNPLAIYSSKFVVAIGSSVSTRTGAGSEGMLGILMGMQAINDLSIIESPDMLARFMDVLPLRVLYLLIMTFLCYVVKWTPLATAPTLAYLFSDTILTGYTFTVVREEHNEQKKQIVREQRYLAEKDLEK
ncbi:hypothetical protein DASB73_003370 [Starmerella bacillaris]|uniref:Uncharacterized protein n=1 Tax=Starmerella bacillaris TaxID=1247836 RepID=A0AAV5RD17_STABA|nr:hypothetical protein DASB73_003370 [Starmerella bacillaris]